MITDAIKELRDLVEKYPRLYEISITNDEIRIMLHSEHGFSSLREYRQLQSVQELLEFLESNLTEK